MVAMRLSIAEPVIRMVVTVVWWMMMGDDDGGPMMMMIARMMGPISSLSLLLVM